MDEYMTTDEVAELCRTSPATVRYWKHTGYGPGAYAFKVGRRVLYNADKVRGWLAEQSRSATTAAGGAAR